MLQGRLITLRPMRESDLAALYAAHTDIANRGRFFPLGVMSESAFRREFAEKGFWQREEGMLLLRTPDDQLAGHIEVRGAFFNEGRNQDVLLYGLLRDDRRPWHEAT